MIRVLWFSWARERIGSAEEMIELPEDVTDLAGFLASLSRRSAAHAEVLAAPGRLHFAVNLDMATPTHALRDGDEVAIFPPITGG